MVMRLRQTQKDRFFPQEFSKLRPNSWCSTLEPDNLFFLDAFRRRQARNSDPHQGISRSAGEKDRSEPGESN